MNCEVYVLWCFKYTIGSICEFNSNSKIDNTMINITGKMVTLGNLEIAQYDFEEQLTWDEAINACAALGDGWRLPTRQELNEIVAHKENIEGLTATYYWSSTKYFNYHAWLHPTHNGGRIKYANKNLTFNVRAVRTCKESNY